MIKKAAKKGLLIESCGTYGNCIRFLCPLVVTDEQLNAGLAIMRTAMEECLAEQNL